MKGFYGFCSKECRGFAQDAKLVKSYTKDRALMAAALYHVAQAAGAADRPSRKRPRTGGEAGHTLPFKKVRSPLPRRPSSGFYGVSANNKRWQAKITYDGKQHYLRSFATKEEAALVYDRKARSCGEIKNLNWGTIAEGEQAAAQAVAEYAKSPRASTSKPPTVSGFHGVSPNGKRWQASISYIGGKLH
jgi:hypothetical protein